MLHTKEDKNKGMLKFTVLALQEVKQLFLYLKYIFSKVLV